MPSTRLTKPPTLLRLSLFAALRAGAALPQSFAADDGKAAKLSDSYNFTFPLANHSTMLVTCSFPLDLDGMEDLTPCDVETVGWLIDETPMIYALAQSITEAVDASGVFVIIKSCVTSVRELAPGEQKQRRKRGKL